MTRRGRIRAGVGLAAVIVAALVVLRASDREGEWSLALHGDATTVRPWQSTALTADLGGTAVSTGWQVRWHTADGRIDGTGPAVRWRAGEPGVHQISVDVTSPSGVRRTAATSITVIAAGPADPPPPPGVVVVDPGELPFRITDVVVDKDSLCRDEPTAIRVIAEDDRGDTGWLEPRIAGQPGWSVTYRRTGQPGLLRVPVELRDPTLDAQVDTDVYMGFRDCVADWVLFLRPRPDRYREERYELAAVLHPGPALEQFAEHGGTPPDTRADSYAWEAGDGASVVTREPTLVHTFPAEADRPTGERAHTYVVRVEARDHAGQPLAVATTSIVLENRIRAFRHDGDAIMLVGEQGAPTDGDDGQRRVAVSLRNLDTETAALRDLDLELVPCDGSTPEHRAASVASVFPTDRIAGGTTIRGVLAWSRADARRICHVDVTARGTSEPGGLPVTGNVTLRLGTGDAIAIADADRVALLEKVRALTGGTGRFSPVDIQRLEDQGKLPPGTLAALTAPPPSR